MADEYIAPDRRPEHSRQQPANVTSILTCHWPGCPRSYKRTDHLNRHLKTHLGETGGHSCSFCHKEYSRSDVLARHLVQVHGQKAAGVGRPRKVACLACVTDRVICDGVPPTTCSRCLGVDRACQYRHLMRGNQNSAAGTSGNRPRPFHASFQGQPLETSTGVDQVRADGDEEAVRRFPKQPASARLGHVEDDDQVHHILASVDENATPDGPTSRNGWMVPCGSLMPDLAMPLPSTESTMANPLSPHTMDPSDWFPDLFLSATAQVQSEDALMTATDDSVVPRFDRTFDWGFTDANSDMFESIGAHAPSDLANSHNTTNTPRSFLRDLVTAPELDSEIVKALKAEEVDGLPNAEDLPNGSPEQSSWPNFYKPDTPGTPVALPVTRPSTPKNHCMVDVSAQTPTASVNARARNSMRVLARYAHRSVWRMPELATFPSTSSLTTCINLYLANFSPWLPIVDSPQGSFRVDKAAPILLMAMAAVGSVYGSQGLDSLASPLNELVRREIVYTCEYDERFVFERCIVQASLLQSHFGLYSGSPRLFQQSEVSRSSLVATCRRMHLLHNSTYSAAKELARRKPTAISQEEKSRAVRQDHRDLRLGWSIFLFDAQLACFFGLPAQYPMADIVAPLPIPVPDPSNIGSPFGRVMTSILDRGQLPEQPSDMGLTCVAFALYRLCLEASSLQGFSSEPYCSSRYNLVLPAYRHHPQALLDQIARLALNTSPSSSFLNPLRLSCVALAHHSHLQFTGIGLLDQIKVAAGRSGDRASRDAAQANVATRLRGNPTGARNIFAHAALLRCLLNRFTFDTPTELVWIFDAALCMWAFLCFSGLSFSNSAGPGSISDGGDADRRYLFSWQASPSLDEWIELGGGDVSVQGLGSGADINVEAVLRGAAERLGVMSWGLAARYREVLKDLLAESNSLV